MSFIGMITNVKNETYLSKVLSPYFQKEQIIFITDKNIENMRHIQFETLILDTEIKEIEALRTILLKTKYVLLNVDRVTNTDILEELNLIVISYGFQNKATFTISSVIDTEIMICLQRIMESIHYKKYEPQELRIKIQENLDIHLSMCLQILLLLYEKIQILVNEGTEKNTKIDKK